jgi:hypothetical protein
VTANLIEVTKNVANLSGFGCRHYHPIMTTLTHLFASLQPDALVQEFVSTLNRCLATAIVGVLTSMVMPKPRRKP